MSKLNFSLSVSFVALLLFTSGCTAHHRQAMDAYRQNEPTPFAKRTMDWANRAEKESAASPPAQPEPPTISDDLKIALPQDAFLAMAAEYFGSDPTQLSTRLKALEQPDALKKILAEKLEFDDLLLAVAVENPSVKAARERWSATLNQYSQADYLDQLVNQYRTFTRYLKVETGKPVNKEMEQAFFPFPSTIALKGELIRQQVRLAELDWQQTLREQTVEAGTAFFEDQYLLRAEATTAENVRLIQNLLDVIQERSRVGQAGQPDILRLQTELERQRNMQKDLAARRRVSEGRINAQLGRAPDAPLGTPSEHNLDVPTLELASFLAQALKQRQEVNMQSVKTERTKIAIRLGEVMNRPLASQGASLSERGMMPEASPGDSSTSFGLKSKASDRPNFAQAESYLTEMRKRLAAEQSALEQIKAQTGALARGALESLDVARRKVDLIEQTILPQSRSTYDTTLKSYSSGKASFIDLLDTERALLRVGLEMHEAREALNKAVLDLAKARGSLHQ